MVMQEEVDIEYHLLADTGACNTNELAKMMNDRDDWKKRVFEVKRLKRRPK